MLSNRRIAQYAVSGLSIAILTVAAPRTGIAQPTPRLDYQPPAPIAPSSLAPLRLGVSAREAGGEDRIVPLAATSRTYRPSRSYLAGLDSAAARRMRQRLIHTAIGAIGGAAIGTAIGALATARPAGQGCHELCSNRGIGVVYLGVAGLLAGAVTGAVWPTH
jgi:hypothetical protein